MLLLVEWLSICKVHGGCHFVRCMVVVDLCTVVTLMCSRILIPIILVLDDDDVPILFQFECPYFVD